MVDGLTTVSCVSLVDVCGLGAPPPGSPGGAPSLFSLACEGAASRGLPGMETFSGLKWPVMSVRVNGISFVHLTRSALVNTCRPSAFSSDSGILSQA